MDKRAAKKTLHATLALALALPPMTAMAVTDIESDDVVISATKTEKRLQDVPSTVTLVDADQAAEYGSTTIADMVKDVPGVEIFDNSVAGSKRLMIRGENGGRVIVLIDGQKISEQKSMDGAPLLVDPAIVERIEVIKGSGSVLYGSDAIGGVVNIITKKGGKKALSGDVSGVYRSGTKGYEGSLGLAGNAGSVQYRLTGSYSDQGDRETPDGTLKGSDSTMKNVSGFVGYKTDSLDAGFTLEKYEVAADVPPTPVMGGIMMDLNLPEWSREKAGAFVDFKNISDLITKVHVDAYYQKTLKDFEQNMELPPSMMAGGGMPAMGAPKMGAPKGMPAGVKPGKGGMKPGKGKPSTAGVKPTTPPASGSGWPCKIPKPPGHPANVIKDCKPFGGYRAIAGLDKAVGGPASAAPLMHYITTNNDQKTYAVNGQVDLALTADHYIITGASFSYDTLDATTETSFSVPVMPSSSHFQEASIKNWALYLQDEWSVADDLTLTLGVRETWVESELDKTDDPRIKTGSMSDSHPAFSAGITWNTTEELTLRGLFSQGYRFPDLTKLFIGTTHGGEMTLANPDLDPETSNNFEIGARFADDHLKTDFAVFCSMAENYINRQEVRPGYNRYENVDEAKTYGAEIWLGYRFDRYNMQPYVNGTIMRREYQDGDFSTWKTKTPLFSGRIGVKFEQPMGDWVSKVWGDLYVRTATKAEDEARNGMIETNDGWSTLNLAVGTSWGENDRWKASININNIFDESYTTAQNTLEEEGVNVVARLAVSF